MTNMIIMNRNDVLEQCAEVMKLAISAIIHKEKLYTSGVPKELVANSCRISTASLAYSAAINMINAYVKKDKKIEELLEKLYKANKSALLVSEEVNPWAFDVYLRNEVSKGKSEEEAYKELFEKKFSLKYGEPDLFKFVKDKKTENILVELDEMIETIRSYKT